MGSPHRALTAALLLACSLAPAAAAQQVDAGSFLMPEGLQSFWSAWWEARERADEGDMDEVVRRNRDEAVRALDVILDDLSKRDEPAKHFEARSLAWSLDRVNRTERYIERVRLVLDLDQRSRFRRSQVLADVDEAGQLESVAFDERSEEAWRAVTSAYEKALVALGEIGDLENVVYVNSRLAEIERRRLRDWERSRYLAAMLEAARQLPFERALADEVERELAGLRSVGIDPDQPKPEEPGEAPPAEAADAGKGRTLTSWAPGSTEQAHPLELTSAKKGLPEVALPTFHPVEQHQLWPMAYVDRNGPTDFHYWQVLFHPGGTDWSLLRSAIVEFGIDSDADGKADVTFTPSSTPARIEVPRKGGAALPLMVATLSDKEKLFGLDLNYAPTQDVARLRFLTACWLEGEVLGQAWKVYDANVDGNFGPASQGVDDQVTHYEREGGVSWFAPDAVLIGRAKKAVPLSTVMKLGDRWYNTRLEQDQGRVVLRELLLQTGFVQVEGDWGVAPAHLVVREVDGKLEGAFFDVLPERRGGKVELPAGRYQIAMGVIQKGKRTSLDQVRIYTGTSEPFEVEEGKTVKLQLGAPYTLTFSSRTEGPEAVLETERIRCFGRGGEEYAVFFDEPLQPDVEVRRGKKTERPETLRRAGLEAWQAEGDKVLWFPLPFRYESRGDPVQFRLSQKEHALLGGPFQSEWAP